MQRPFPRVLFPRMFSDNDLIDAILRELKRREAPSGGATPATPQNGAKPAPPTPPARWKFTPEPGPKGRPFLTEAVIRKALTPGARHLTIARDAIVSPLALDWLALSGIQLIRE